jgi:hypothetical protein
LDGELLDVLHAALQVVHTGRRMILRVAQHAEGRRGSVGLEGGAQAMVIARIGGGDGGVGTPVVERPMWSLTLTPA